MLGYMSQGENGMFSQQVRSTYNELFSNETRKVKTGERVSSNAA
jgi:hypothetical protein